MSRPYAEVIGDPIAQSKSPLIHNFWLAKLGIDAEYRACHVRPEELADYFAQRRRDAEWRGCNVTIPHKVSVLDLVDELDVTAREVGAANCIAPKHGKLLAFNTDISGVAAAVPDGFKPVCLIGAGGAARSIFSALDPLCVFNYRVLARDLLKARRALSHLPSPFEITYFPFEEAEQAMEGVGGVINASPLGMVGKPEMPNSVFDALSATAIDAYVFDMVYSPIETELLKSARKHGLLTVDGLIMLIGQAAVAFELFFGQPAPREHDAELRELLTQ